MYEAFSWKKQYYWWFYYNFLQVQCVIYVFYECFSDKNRWYVDVEVSIENEKILVEKGKYIGQKIVHDSQVVMLAECFYSSQCFSSRQCFLDVDFL